MAITRDSRHKRRHTGGRRAIHKKKRQFETGRPAAMTKLGEKTVHIVRARGGNPKFRALRLTEGNFSWGSEVIARKTRIIDVVYNASNNELVRTKTLVKSAIVEVDATPFRDWFEKHYHYRIPVKGKEEGGPIAVTGKDGKTPSKVAARQAVAASRLADEHFREQFNQGRLLASISSRPGQSGRADGYLLEGKELEFYSRQISLKKKK
mmetsp:Transcript_32878/g.75705  ORF Transcript_32878/g.75705 Transcript_32878/m.75705 type:complete len:208 (-) Transcript_32878:112-735(-)|eukprot:CAMPEP_0116850920 /NCGR_PEP_ID=MMETSP0418-20121206/16427_1 /TAXON_ID=1158023 /ORGANISM="Astrosyne radiata, Strain 13vi08-1A" /LENGTH=207 /DNA_ID=CAMNT_0004482869 /DNA_START=35 /DNA_END=658 /DNA_ORIENTATION=+